MKIPDLAWFGLLVCVTVSMVFNGYQTYARMKQIQHTLSILEKNGELIERFSYCGEEQIQHTLSILEKYDGN